MEHQTFREMLARRPELWPIEESELRAHLQDCPECRGLAEAYARQTFLLHNLPEAIPPPALRAGVLDAIRRQPEAPGPLWRRPLALVPLAAALLVVGIGLSTLHPLSGGQHSASGIPTSVHATPKVLYEGQAPKRRAPDASSAALQRIRRAAVHRGTRTTATASGYTPAGTVARNPPAPAVPPVAVQPVVPTPTPLPAVHVAAGAPSRGSQVEAAATTARKSRVATTAGKARKATPRQGATAGGGASVGPSGPPSQPALPVPSNPPADPVPAAPPPTPVPFTTPPVASYAPIRGTATASPTSTPPLTPAPFASPYPDPQATPTSTP